MPGDGGRLELRQLATFLQVAELGSVSKAAQRLRIAQPALSRQLRQLEAELKVALFTRHGRGMALTAAGELLCARAASVLRTLDDTRAELLLAEEAEGGAVVFGMPPTVGELLAARLIERFMARHPAISLRFVVASTGYLLDWLQSGQVDIALVHAPEDAPKLKLTPLLEEALYFVSAANRPAADRQPLKLAEVARHRLVMPGAQHGLRILVEREARRLGLRLDVAVEADSLAVLKTLVQRRLGATILPFAAVHQEVASGLVYATPIAKPQLARILVVAQPAQARAPLPVRRFAQVLEQEVTAMVKAQAWLGRLVGSE